LFQIQFNASPHGYFFDLSPNFHEILKVDRMLGIDKVPSVGLFHLFWPSDKSMLFKVLPTMFFTKKVLQDPVAHFRLGRDLLGLQPVSFIKLTEVIIGQILRLIPGQQIDAV